VIRKPGFLTFVGSIATIINLTLGTGIQFLGFLAASTFFDVALAAIGYSTVFKKPAYTIVSMMVLAITSAAVAGTVIGSLFMTGSTLARWGGVAGWTGLHMIGGAIGGFIGITLVLALKKRRITVYNESPS